MGTVYIMCVITLAMLGGGLALGKVFSFVLDKYILATTKDTKLIGQSMERRGSFIFLVNNDECKVICPDGLELTYNDEDDCVYNKYGECLGKWEEYRFRLIHGPK